MTEIVYTRAIGAMPRVIRQDNTLLLEFGAGADPNHEVRTFTVPISQDHLEVIQANFTRHFLLWSILLPLGDDAGSTGPLNTKAAKRLVDTVLLAPEAEVEALFKNSKWYEGHLIAHHADPTLIALGKIFDAAQSLTPEADFKLAQEYEASRRHLFIAPLDEAVLRYTNQYLYGGGLPSRNPDAVDPSQLTKVLAVVASAEKACAGMELPMDYGTDYKTNHARDKEAWNVIKFAVQEELKASYPELQSKSVDSLSFLLCSEAATRAKNARKNSQ